MSKGNVFSYLPIHMLAWQDSAEESWPEGPSLAPPADSTSAAWLVMSRYSWMNWYKFMMREASTMPFSLLICQSMGSHTVKRVNTHTHVGTHTLTETHNHGGTLFLMMTY